MATFEVNASRKGGKMMCDEEEWDFGLSYFQKHPDGMNAKWGDICIMEGISANQFLSVFIGVQWEFNL